jgi:hypothetical protein
MRSPFSLNFSQSQSLFPTLTSGRTGGGRTWRTTYQDAFPDFPLEPRRHQLDPREPPRSPRRTRSGRKQHFADDQDPADHQSSGK